MSKIQAIKILKLSLYFFVGFWSFIGFIVLVLGQYPKAGMVFILAFLSCIFLYWQIVENVFTDDTIIKRLLVPMFIAGLLLCIHILAIKYAVGLNYRVSVNCGIDAHELFWSPITNECEGSVIKNMILF